MTTPVPRNRVAQWIEYRLPVFSWTNKHVIDYPTPRNLNYWWNFGSLAERSTSVEARASTSADGFMVSMRGQTTPTVAIAPMAPAASTRKSRRVPSPSGA